MASLKPLIVALILSIITVSLYLSSVYISKEGHNEKVAEKLKNLRVGQDFTWRNTIKKSFETDVLSSKTAYIPKQNNLTFIYKSDALPCHHSYPEKCEMYPYVKFWHKETTDKDCYVSPTRHPLKSNAPLKELKFLVFQPDGGGWNNIRMAAETAVVFALATGRVLVLPPKTKWYLLDKNKNEEDNKSSFATYYDLHEISDYIDMISMEEFIEHVAKPGLLNAPLPVATNSKEFATDRDKLWKYLERACYTREWEPGKRFIGFNLTLASDGKTVIYGDVPYNKRAKRFASHDRKIVSYDARFHAHRAVYFPGDYRNAYRILTHFYSYLYFADPKIEHIYKRIIRDKFHYQDEIFCHAGRAIQQLHLDAAQLNHKPVQDIQNYNPKTGGGWMNNPVDKNNFATYHALHIRRGDFQYEHTRVSAEQIYETIRHLLHANVTKLLYIATDEKNHDFFAPFHKDFKVVFLDNYMSTIQGKDKQKINANMIGMIEQVICANAYTFIGTPLSTFTGYITRMRGYYNDGRYERTYYNQKDTMYQLQVRHELLGPFWAREFAVAHKNIDDDSPSNTIIE